MDDGEDIVPVCRGFENCFFTRYFIETGGDKETTLEWLRSLDQDTFNMLHKETEFYGEQCQDDATELLESERLNDITFLFFHLVAMELNISAIDVCDMGIFNLDEEFATESIKTDSAITWLKNFMAMVAMESLRRKNFVTISGPGKITEDSGTIIKIVKKQGAS